MVGFILGLKINGREKVADFLQPKLINLVKSGEPLTVDVKDSNNPSSTIMDWHYDLTLRQRTAGDMSWEQMHIRHHLSGVFFPGRSAHSPALLYPRACQWSLERAKQKSVLTDHTIEPSPPKFKLFMEHSRHVRHIGDHVGLSLKNGFDLREEFRIFLFFSIHIDLG